MTLPATLTPPRRAGPAGWSPADFAVLRFGSVPAGVLEQLRFDSAELVRRHLDLEGRLRRSAETLGLELEARVAEAGGRRELRLALINLRRSIREGRAPSERDLAVLRAEDHPALPSVQAWAASRQELQGLEARFEREFLQEYGRVQQRLKEAVVRSEDLLAALEATAPDFLDSLQQYLAAAPSPPSTWRKVENTLTVYLSRCALKTSPLSRFTHTALGRAGAAPQGAAFCARVDLHRALVEEVYRHVLGHPDLQPYLPLALNPDLARGDGGWTLLQRQRDAQGRARDRWLQLPTSPALQAVGELLEGGPLARGDLEQALCHRLGVPEGQAGRVRGFVEQLLERQVLLPAEGFADMTPDPLGRLEAFLTALPLERARGWAEELRRLRACLRQYGRTDHRTRRGLRRRVEEALAGLLPPGAPLPPPGRLLCENSVARLPGLGPLPELCTDELQGVARLALLVGQANRQHLALVERFVGRFGPGAQAPLQEFLLGSGPPCPHGRDYLDGLAQARQEAERAVEAVLERVRALMEADPQADEIDLGVDWANTQLPHRLPGRPVRALSLFLQAAGSSGAPATWVLNSVSKGFGALAVRALAALGDGPEVGGLARDVAASLARAYPGKRPLQLAFKTDSTINAFPALLPERLCAPGNLEPGLRVQDLWVRHNPHEHSLELLHRGQEVLPVYISSYTPELLAPLERDLAYLAPLAGFRAYFAEVLHARQPGARRRWPRVRLGSVVLARRAWVLPEPQRLARAKGEGDFRYWRRLLAWSEAEGVPRRFFLYPDRWQALQQDVHEQISKTSLLKPQYIDLDSFFFVRVLERCLAEVCGAAWLQEALPAPGEGTVVVDGERYVGEWCVELRSEGGAYRP